MFMWHNTTWMWLSMLIFWSSIGVVAVYAVRAWRRPGPRRSARELLDDTYARGEISTDEYRERRQTLNPTVPHQSAP